MPHESPWLDGAEESIISSLQTMLFEEIVKISAMLNDMGKDDHQLYKDIKNRVDGILETLAKALASQICLICGKLSDTCRGHRLGLKSMEIQVCQGCFRKCEDGKDTIKDMDALVQAIIYANPKSKHIARDILQGISKTVKEMEKELGLEKS